MLEFRIKAGSPRGRGNAAAAVPAAQSQATLSICESGENKRHLLLWHGAADIEALHLGDAVFARDQRQLLAGLDALDGHRQVSALRRATPQSRLNERLLACKPCRNDRSIFTLLSGKLCR